ncbi:hypothetical protein JG688_00017237 [Phytophthora aleatoria]|uniref:Uncharacterized protein n=1 Tax=Phytophthora aleatoria TaxID=2496075 RepID=A0A8J5IAU8_9STRA|nr:hypothetical protein JG688_00017237 [Phytophthora aleatoria]
MAEAWYDDMNAQLQMLTFAQVGAELIKHFRTAMTDLQITTQMCTSRKKASETYQQFANRLLGMADLIKGGRAAEHNARLALQSFCAHAYPATQETLEIMVNIGAVNPLLELQRAVPHLSKISNSDGAVDESKRRNQQRYLPTKRAATGPAHARVVVERSR